MREWRSGAGEVRFTHRAGVLQTLFFATSFSNSKPATFFGIAHSRAEFELTIVLSNTFDRLPMSIPPLVTSFYDRLWNAGDEAAVPDLLALDFSFRGSLGAELKGHAAFWDYVCGVRTALAHYRCDILECVSEGHQAFAKMRFSGTHVSVFRGHRPTGLPIRWEGAALFHFEAGRIRELWVLGDLAGLDALLKSNAE
jgi:predicted ester cyclase